MVSELEEALSRAWSAERASVIGIETDWRSSPGNVVAREAVQSLQGQPIISASATIGLFRLTRRPTEGSIIAIENNILYRE